MPGPLEVENKFQNLKHLLKFITGRRTKILKIISFIEEILSHNNKLYIKSYAKEILSMLKSQVVGCDFEGTNINFFDKVIFVLEKFNKEIIISKDIEVVEKLIDIIKLEKEKIINFVNQKNKPFLETNRINQIRAVNIPLVENELMLKRTKSEFASIKKIKASVSFEEEKSKDDKFNINWHLILGKNADSTNTELLNVAKLTFEQISGIKIKKKINCSCIFEENISLTGESLDAGLVTLIVCELIKLHQFKDEYYIYEHSAITGGIDQEGKLLNVDNESLKLKIEACLFSPVKYLVVPKSQETQAKKYLEEIKNGYDILKGDGLWLEIIGFSKIADIFSNRNIINKIKTSFFKLIVRKIWKLRRPIGLSLLLLSGITIFLLLYGPLDKNPVNYKIEGNIIWILNKFGQKLESIQVHNPMIYETNQNLFTNLIDFADLDGDNTNEILMIINENHNLHSALICFNVNPKKIQWQKKYSINLICPEDPIPCNLINIRNIKIRDTDKDGKNEIYIVGSICGYFPGLLIKIDHNDGKIIDYYIHDGNLDQMLLIDLDGNGKEEILLTGQNNSFKNKAPIIVLNPKKLNGYTVHHSQRHKILDQSPAKEMKYLLIPRTIVGEALSLEATNTQSNIVLVDYKDKKIIFSITEAIFRTSYSNVPIFNLTTDLNFNILNISTNDSYYIFAEFLFNQKRIPKIPDKTYWEEYKKKIEIFH